MAYRPIAFRLFIDWDFNGVYTDESQYLVQASGELEISPPDEFLTSGKGRIDSCTLEMRNASGRFSPLNTSGALYTYIQNGKAYHAPMYLEVSINGGSDYSRVFTGVAKIPREAGHTLRDGPTVFITCRSKDELLIQQRASTSLHAFHTWINNGYTEADLIGSLLSGSGLSTSLDAGLSTIRYVWLDDDSILEDIWLLAAAAGGRFYVDPDGTARYENAAHWLSHSTSTETLTRDNYDRPLEVVYSDGDLFNVVTVESSTRFISSWDVVWEPEEPVVVAPGETKKIMARLQQPIYSTYGADWQATTSGGIDITGDVTVAATYYAQRVEFSITNGHATSAAYMRKFKLVGQPVLGGPTHEESRNSTEHGSNASFFTNRGTRTRSIRTNPYVQGRAQAGMLALFLLHQSEYMRLEYKVGGCEGVPARRLGNRITLNDPSVMTSARDAFITRIAWRLTPNGFTQDIGAVDAAQLYPYQSEGYFVIGTNALGVASKRVFY